MSTSPLLDVLDGVLEHAYGLTWVGDAVSATAPAGSDTSPAAVARSASADFVFVDAEDEKRRVAVEALTREGVEPVWAVPGPLTRVVREQGWATVMRDSLLDPRLLERHVQTALRACLEAVDEGVAVGVRVFLLADEIASSAGWLVEPAFVHARLVPAYSEFARAVNGAGGRALMHSDGDIASLAPALSTGGFRALHCASGGATSSAWRAIRTEGLVPAGGIAIADVAVRPAESVDAAVALAIGGPALVCDDGSIASFADLRVAATALCAVRMRVAAG